MGLWMFLMATPFMSVLAGILLCFNLSVDIRILSPDTKRTLGKDILLTIGTLGIFGLVLPYLLMRDVRDGAERNGIQVPDYIVPYYFMLLGSIGCGLLILTKAIAPSVGVLVGIVVGMLQAYFFVKPFNMVAEQFGRTTSVAKAAGGAD